MPHRRYHPRVPPTAMDHWLAHPYELSTAVAGLAAARSEPAAVTDAFLRHALEEVRPPAAG